MNTKETQAKDLAEKVAAFIKHNKIDLSKVNLDKVVEIYFKKQLEAIEEAGNKARIFFA